MTIEELILRLSEYPKGTIVTLSGDYGYGAGLYAWGGNWESFGVIWEEN